MKKTWFIKIEGQPHRKIEIEGEVIKINENTVVVEKFGRRRIFYGHHTNQSGQEITDCYTITPKFSLMTLFLSKSLYINSINCETGEHLSNSGRLTAGEIFFWIILQILFIVVYVSFEFFPLFVGFLSLIVVIIYCLLNFCYHVGKEVIVTRIPYVKQTPITKPQTNRPLSQPPSSAVLLNQHQVLVQHQQQQPYIMYSPQQQPLPQQPQYIYVGYPNQLPPNQQQPGVMYNQPPPMPQNMPMPMQMQMQIPPQQPQPGAQPQPPVMYGAPMPQNMPMPMQIPPQQPQPLPQGAPYFSPPISFAPPPIQQPLPVPIQPQQPQQPIQPQQQANPTFLIPVDDNDSFDNDNFDTDINSKLIN